MAEMIVKIGADVQPAVAGINQVGVSLDNLHKKYQIVSIGSERFGLTFKNLTDKVAQFGGGVNRFIPPVISSFQRLPAAITPAVAALQKLPATSSAATQSLINLSRVAQDAPYGFIGIANNLNPLLESFQRLKASTGSTGSALKALGSSLTGAGGIGLALGIVSSLLVVFGDKLFGSSKAAKEAEDSNKKLAESISGDIVKITSLVAVATNLTGSYESRAKGMAAINQEYGPLLKNLGIEEVNAGNIALAYDKITNALLRQAVVKGLQGEIEKAVQKTASSIINLEKTESKRAASSENVNKQIKVQKTSLESAIEGQNKFNNVKRDGILTNIQSTNQITKEVKGLNDYQTARDRLEASLKKDLEPLFGILKTFSFDDLDIGLNKPSVYKTNKDIETIVEKAKRISDAFENIIDIQFATDFGDTESQIKQKATEFLSKFKNEEFKIKISPELEGQEFRDRTNLLLKTLGRVKIIADVIPNITNEEFEKLRPVEIPFKSIIPDVERFDAIISNAIEKEPYDVTIQLAIDKEALEKSKQQFIDSFFGLGRSIPKDLFTDIEISAIIAADTINGVLQPAFTGLFDAIKSGTNGLQGFFNGLIQGVERLVQKLLAAAVLAAVLSAVIPGSIGFGKIFSKILGFAGGGEPPVGRASMVGEKGPELFIPRVAGTIIPNHKLRDFNIPRREFGGVVSAGIQYLTGEKGRELFVPQSTNTIKRAGPSGLAGSMSQIVKVVVTGELSGRSLKLVQARQNSYDSRNV